MCLEIKNCKLKIENCRVNREDRRFVKSRLSDFRTEFTRRGGLSALRSAMTLIELMVVIVILVTLVAGVLPLVSPNNDARKIAEAARGLQTYFMQAQAEAARLGRPVGVGFRETTAGSNVAGALTLSGATIVGINGFGLSNSSVIIADGTTNTIQVDGGTGSGNTVSIPNLTGNGTLTVTSTVADKWYALNGTAEFTGTLNLTGVTGATNNVIRLTTASGGSTFPNAVVNLTGVTLANRQGGALADPHRVRLDRPSVAALAHRAFPQPHSRALRRGRLHEPGVDLSENGQAVDAILSNGPGQHFLGHPHTLANFETAFYRSETADNNSYEQWLEGGSLDTQRPQDDERNDNGRHAKERAGILEEREGGSRVLCKGED